MEKDTKEDIIGMGLAYTGVLILSVLMWTKIITG